MSYTPSYISSSFFSSESDDSSIVGIRNILKCREDREDYKNTKKKDKQCYFKRKKREK